MARGSGKNIHRNLTRPKVNKAGEVSTMTMRRYEQGINLSEYERWLLAKAIY